MRGRHSIFAVHYFFRCAPHVFSFSVSSATMSSKDVVARRRPLVQSIRQAGGRCNIRGMPDDAGRKRVESFVHRVLARETVCTACLRDRYCAQKKKTLGALCSNAPSHSSALALKSAKASPFPSEQFRQWHVRAVQGTCGKAYAHTQKS